jgi:cytochrome c oxidase subunit 2
MKNLINKNFYLFLIAILFTVLFSNNVLLYTVDLPLGHPKPWQLGFQLPGSPIARGIFAFHDDLMVFLTLILFFVVYVLTVCLYTYSATKVTTTQHIVHASTLEIIWTLIPALVLIVIAIPSFSLLYSVDEIVEPLLTVKIIGHQWYWSYELFDSETLAEILRLEFTAPNSAVDYSTSFDSYMLAEEDVVKEVGLSNYRLYVVDKHLGLPSNVSTRLLITSNDVLHSWAVPSLGIKIDACPGRLNQGSLFIKYSGLYYGQCSEICGTNHGFMPIGIVCFDLGLPTSLLELLFFDLEPLIASLQNLARE